MNKIRNKITIGLSLIFGLVSLPQISETIYTPALPEVAKGLAASAQAVEATLSMYFLGFAFGVFIWGICSDLIGRRQTMILGLIIYIVSCVGCLMSQSIHILLAWRLLQAVGASVGSVVSQTMLRDVYDGKKRAKIFALISAALSLSPAIGPVIGGLLSGGLGWRSNFAFLIILGIILTLWAFWKLPETRPEHVEIPGRKAYGDLCRRMFSSITLWGHVLLIGATNGIIFCFYQEAPFIFIDQMGLSPGVYGLLGLVVASATIVSAKLSYRLSGWYAPESLITVGAFTATSGGMALILMQQLGLFQFHGLIYIVIGLFTTFVGVGLIIPNSLSIALKNFQDLVGTAGSIFGALYYLVIALATWGMSILHDGSALPLPMYLTFLGLLLLVGSFFVQPHIEVEKKEMA